MAYNITTISVNASSGLLGMFQGVNDVLFNGFYGAAILMGLGVIFFMAFIAATGDGKKALAATTTIIFVLSLLLRAVSLVSDKILFITLISMAVSIAFLWKSN